MSLMHKIFHILHLQLGSVVSFAFARRDRKPGVVIVIGFECADCGRLSGVHAASLCGSLDSLEGL